ncbi:GrBNV gp48-like protein [Tomelloso virus]|uniref:GrBNV gp48-like protein n=1 Tax=Tomelloso virus TaxID=2053981 RepID=A0A2H4T2U7_9VIRU|nr:GrBNV gp48-like protein [Tomelloso virus]ATY70188.1 GrBNV gp48-like protein [Tomelloso virus]
MEKLYSSDIFKIYNNREASRAKIWEMVRSFNPVEFAKLLYLLENVSTSTNRVPVQLPDSLINYCPEKWQNDCILELCDDRSIRLERGVYENENVDIFWNDGCGLMGNQLKPQIAQQFENANGCDAKTSIEKLNNADNYASDFPIDDLFSYIRCKNIIQLSNDDDDDDEKGVAFKILNHNIGTRVYKTLLNQIENLLLNDNYQDDRNEQRVESSSIVTKFMQFYTTMNFKQRIDNDARNFRNLILARPKRIVDRQLMSATGEYFVQPLYQGFHVIVYSTPMETKCYSRYGELQVGLGYALRCPVPCTFEAIILPIDRYGNVRCWRYWQYRSGYVIYVVDVYRYKQTILLHIPFEERLPYVDLVLRSDKSGILQNAPVDTWSNIESAYNERQDLYDPIVGVYLRQKNQTVLTLERPKAFYFNILFSFDIMKEQIVDLRNEETLDIVHRLHLNYEMADYKTICTVYGHCEKYFYLCTYNRHLQQFVHAAKLRRSPLEYFKLKYRSDAIFVVNNQIIPRGILYLRVYYDLNRKIIGYENKMSDDRFKVPFTSPLLG